MNDQLIVDVCLEILEEEWKSEDGKNFKLKRFYDEEIKSDKPILSYPEFTKVKNQTSSPNMTSNMANWLLKFIDKKYGIILKKNSSEFIKNENVYKKIKIKDGVNHFSSYGLEKIFESIPNSLITEAINQSNSIWICDTRLPEWIIGPIKEAIIKRKAKVRIMILDPESKVCDLRSKSLGDYTLGEIRANVLMNLSSFLNEDLPEDLLSIYLLKDIPTINAYKIDDKIWMGQYPFHKSSESGPYFQIKSANNPLSRYVNDQLGKVLEAYPKPNTQAEINDVFSYCNQNLATRSATRILSFVGTYYVYYTEKLTRNEALKNSKIIKPIGVNVLNIKYEKGVFPTRMKTPHDLENQREYFGEVVLDSGKPSLLVFDLKAPDSYANFIFEHSGNAISGEPIFGSYNISYYRKNGNGIGVAVLIKTEEKYEDIHPCSIDPLSKHERIHEKLAKYLMFEQRSVLKPVLRKEQLKQTTRFQGNYLVYSSHKKDGKRFISVSMIKIFPSGYVLFKRKRLEGDGEAEGYIKIVGNSLQVLVVNKTRKLNGYFIMETLDNPPNEERIYSGVYSGLSFRDLKPMTSRIIWAYTDKKYEEFTPEKVAFFSEAMNDIPDQIRLSLCGRTGNSTGFFRYRSILNLNNLEEQNKKEIDYGEVFYDSAIMKARNQNVDLSIKMITRSIEHSTSTENLINFKSELEENNLISSELASQIKQHKKYKALLEKYNLE